MTTCETCGGTGRVQPTNLSNPPRLADTACPDCMFLTFGWHKITDSLDVWRGGLWCEVAETDADELLLWLAFCDALPRSSNWRFENMRCVAEQYVAMRWGLA